MSDENMKAAMEAAIERMTAVSRYAEAQFNSSMPDLASDIQDGQATADRLVRRERTRLRKLARIAADPREGVAERQAALHSLASFVAQYG